MAKKKPANLTARNGEDPKKYYNRLSRNSDKTKKPRETSTKPMNRIDFDIREGESTTAYYRRLAKAADQRLVRLEKLSQQKGYKGAKSFAYARAISDIQIYNPKGTRFNAAISKDPRILKEQTMSVLEFLKAPTSTKMGIDTGFRKRVETLNAKYGTDFTWQELADFFGKGQAQKIFGQFAGNSEPGMKAIATIRKTEKAIKEGTEENLSVTLSGPEKEAVKRVLARRKYIGGREYDKELKDQIRTLLLNS